jgi:hypothetical protein
LRQPGEHQAGVVEDRLLAVAPGQPARDRVVQRQIEAERGVEPRRQRADDRVEDRDRRRVLAAAGDDVEDLVAQDRDPLAEIGHRRVSFDGRRRGNGGGLDGSRAARVYRGRDRSACRPAGRRR